MFDSTPSGAWIPSAVILGKTGIAMSVRGESFWLDQLRAAQLRPRSRPRYTLTPSIVLRNGEPFMAIGTPGGDNQEQTILQAFLNVVEFWPEWFPNLHDGVPLAARPDVALLRILLAAHGGVQQAERGIRHARRRVRGAPIERSRRQQDRAGEHPQLRDGGADRSGNRQPHRGSRSAARLLRDGVLTVVKNSGDDLAGLLVSR